MTTKTYLTVCGVVSVVWIIGLLAIPGFSDLIEQLLLLFLSTNAR
jgi:hypothetical protein|tara:strand:+ start:539 stop:673 length:135 start_codon:yes stop_codon:yes gene_type:complete